MRLPARWLILGVICLAQFAVVLDNTVLNVAIPSLTRDLDGTTAHTDRDRTAVTDAFAAGITAGQLVGAAAVLAGGCLAALLLRRAERRETGT